MESTASSKLKMTSKKLPFFLRHAYDLMPENKRPDPEEFIQYYKDIFKEPVRVTEWKSYRMFPGFEAQTAKYCYENFIPKKGDVVVATYGRTGTHWIQEIRQIMFHNDPVRIRQNQNLSLVFTRLECGPVSKYKVLENMCLERRCFSTHLPAALFNFEAFAKSGAKVFYVIRNPKDQAVSWCKFILSHDGVRNKPLNETYPQDERLFYDSYISGKQRTFAKPGEGYLEHVRDWYQHKDDPNVMILVYEDTKQNPEANIQKIANFVGVELNNEDLNNIANNVSFPSMKSNKNFGDRYLSSKLFRKGEVGAWRDHLTKEHSDLIDRKVEEILGQTDIKFVYELPRENTDSKL